MSNSQPNSEVEKASTVLEKPSLVPSFLKYIKTGFSQASANQRLVLSLYGLNFVFALLLTIPMYAMLDASLSRSSMGDRSLSVLDYTWLAGFLYENRDSMSALSKLTAWASGFYLLLNTLVSAGVLEVLGSGARFSLHTFFGGIGKHGWKFVRLFIVSLFVYFAIFWIFNKAITRGLWFFGGLDGLTKDWTSESAVFYVYLVKNGLLVVVVLFAVMVFDYAKIRLATKLSASAVAETVRAFGFVKRQPGRTLGVFYTFGLVGVVFALIYIAIEGLLPRSLTLGVGLLFLLQQFFMYYRMWLRVALYAAEITVHQDLQSERIRIQPDQDEK